MAWKAAVFLAEGFEEIEAVSVADILRRAGIETTLLSLSDDLLVQGGHGITVKADALFVDRGGREADIFVLPGGAEGVRRLAGNRAVKDAVVAASAEGKMVAALCAAPELLHDWGLLRGRIVTSHPSVKDTLPGAVYSEEAVVVDGNIITSRGAGTAVAFALRIVEMTAGTEKADRIRSAILCGSPESFKVT